MKIKRLLTLHELAAFLRVHPTTVYRLANEGKLAGFRVFSRWRFDTDQVLRELERGANIGLNDAPVEKKRRFARAQIALMLPLMILGVLLLIVSAVLLYTRQTRLQEQADLMALSVAAQTAQQASASESDAVMIPFYGRVVLRAGATAVWDSNLKHARLIQ